MTSAALAAFYAYFVYYSGTLMTESLYILAVLWIVDIVTGMVDLLMLEHEDSPMFEEVQMISEQLQKILEIVTEIRRLAREPLSGPQRMQQA